MKYNDLPVAYLPPADGLLLFKDLTESPDWTHHPYMPVIRGERLEVCRASVQETDLYRVGFYGGGRSQWSLYVTSDSWWLNEARTIVAVRCKWSDRQGDVWWKKNSSMVWFFEWREGEWHKLKLTNKEIKPLIEGVLAFQDLDW